MSLADYRRRYAQYKADPDLQAAHAIAPWLVVPDDHEVENNYANMVRADSSPALTTAQWTARRTAAYQAYYENMPLRPSPAPTGNSIPLYRRRPWGTLATFHMLDTRQFRDDQACGDGNKVCAGRGPDQTRTLTGAAQETWLLDGFTEHLATWDIVGSAGVLRPPVRRQRRRQHGRLGRLPGVPGAHPAGVGGPGRTQPGGADRRRAPGVRATTCRPTTPTRRSATIGTELVCTSITSGRQRYRLRHHPRMPPRTRTSSSSATGDAATSVPPSAPTSGSAAATSAVWPLVSRARAAAATTTQACRNS